MPTKAQANTSRPARPVMWPSSGDWSETRALVQGINLVRRHTKQTASTDAGIFTKEAPIHLSNLAVADKDGKPTRVGFQIKDGVKTRVAKSTGDQIDG